MAKNTGNIQAGLRPELSAVWREWQSAKKRLPKRPLIKPEIEQGIEKSIKRMRRAVKRSHKK